VRRRVRSRIASGAAAATTACQALISAAGGGPACAGPAGSHLGGTSAPAGVAGPWRRRAGAGMVVVAHVSRTGVNRLAFNDTSGPARCSTSPGSRASTGSRVAAHCVIPHRLSGRALRQCKGVKWWKQAQAWIGNTYGAWRRSWLHADYERCKFLIRGSWFCCPRSVLPIDHGSEISVSCGGS
jgi:hypothetical protein